MEIEVDDNFLKYDPGSPGAVKRGCTCPHDQSCFLLEVTNVGTDRLQLSPVAKEAKATLEVENLDAVADRGYFSSAEILACEEAGITITLPKPMTSNSKAEGRFGKQDFRYMAEDDVYVCPAGERLAYSFTTEDKGLVLRRYLLRCTTEKSGIEMYIDFSITCSAWPPNNQNMSRGVQSVAIAAISP